MKSYIAQPKMRQMTADQLSHMLDHSFSGDVDLPTANEYIDGTQMDDEAESIRHAISEITKCAIKLPNSTATLDGDRLVIVATEIPLTENNSNDDRFCIDYSLCDNVFSRMGLTGLWVESSNNGQHIMECDLFVSDEARFDDFIRKTV